MRYLTSLGAYMPKLKLTKTNIDKLPAPQKPQEDHFDTELKGFGIRVNATSKTYFAIGRVNGKQTRVSIGKHGVLTPEQARQEAKLIFGKFYKGINPNKEKAKRRELGITLSEAYEEYSRIRQSKENTLRVDKSLLKCHLSDWLDKPIAEITKDMAGKRHLALRDKVGGNTANNTFRLLRRIYNCTNGLHDGTLPPNPVDRLSDTKQWAKVGRRQTIIKDNDLPAWFDAVLSLENVYMKNYILLQLFTGLRKTEGLSLRWEDVDMLERTFTMPDTKNGKPLTLPMSQFLFSMFQELQANRQSPYVFPALTKNSKTGHMAAPNRQVRAVEKRSDVKFCLHDLRRVFKTTAQDTVTKAESDFLTNHSSKDAGDGYIILSIDKLRIPMEKISEKILNIARYKLN